MSRAGELVTREELRAKLWPQDTFVDFDHGLNNAVNRIREALGDSAGSPRYIETIPRKGYRFIEECSITEGEAPSRPSAAPIESSPLPSFPAKAAWRRTWVLVAAAVFVLACAALLSALAAVGFFRYGSRSAQALTDQDVIVLADIANHTGEPVFDNTLKEALAIDLRQSPFLNLLPDLKVSQTLKMMQRSPGERITADLGREICLRTSSKALLAGSISSLGSHYALQLKATNCQTGETLAAEQAEAESREKVLGSLGGAAARLRSKLGESLPSVRKYDKPLQEVTTSSLEALQAYSEGARTWGQKGDAAAVPFFERAVEVDPNFAAAHNFLYFCYDNQRKSSLALESMRRAYALRERLIEPEKYFVSAWYYSSVTGELAKSVEQFQLLLQEYPKHIYAHGALANQYSVLGQHEKAAAEYREQMRLFPVGFPGLLFGLLLRCSKALRSGPGRSQSGPLPHAGEYMAA